MICELQAEYDATSDATLEKWKNDEGAGALRRPSFPFTKVGVTSGSYIQPPHPAFEILSELEHLAGRDPNADITKPECFHLTFLAILTVSYDVVEELPSVDGLKEIFRRICHGKEFLVQKLGLVALPNALLLAGHPDDASLSLRGEFAEALLASPWKGHLEARYHGGVIPPIFWHTTLVRYHAEYLPEELRAFFKSNRSKTYGRLVLPIHLMSTNYNWKMSVQLD